jgi:hypothetical protein
MVTLVVNAAFLSHFGQRLRRRARRCKPQSLDLEGEVFAGPSPLRAVEDSQDLCVCLILCWPSLPTTFGESCGSGSVRPLVAATNGADQGISIRETTLPIAVKSATASSSGSTIRAATRARAAKSGTIQRPEIMQR